MAKTLKEKAEQRKLFTGTWDPSTRKRAIETSAELRCRHGSCSSTHLAATQVAGEGGPSKKRKRPRDKYDEVARDREPVARKNKEGVRLYGGKENENKQIQDSAV